MCGLAADDECLATADKDVDRTIILFHGRYRYFFCERTDHPVALVEQIVRRCTVRGIDRADNFTVEHGDFINETVDLAHYIAHLIVDLQAQLVEHVVEALLAIDQALCIGEQYVALRQAGGIGCHVLQGIEKSL